MFCQAICGDEGVGEEVSVGVLGLVGGLGLWGWGGVDGGGGEGCGGHDGGGDGEGVDEGGEEQEEGEEEEVVMEGEHFPLLGFAWPRPFGRARGGGWMGIGDEKEGGKAGMRKSEVFARRGGGEEGANKEIESVRCLSPSS